MTLTKEEFAALRSAGLSPRQIGYMGDDAARAELKGFKAGQAAVTGEPKVRPGFVAPAARVLEALPTAGAMVGGGLGGMAGGAAGGIGALPGGLVGAGLGGAAGRVIQNVGRSALGLPQEQASMLGFPVPEAASVPAEAVNQAAYELGGQALGYPMRASGQALMERALKVKSLEPGRGLAPGRLKELASMAIKERIPIGGTKKLGSEKLLEQAQKSGKNLKRILKQADQAGVTIEPDQLANHVIELIETVNKQPAPTADREAIRRFVDDFYANHPGPITPGFVKDFKTQAWELAQPILKKGKPRAGVSAESSINARLNYAFAKGAKDALEGITARAPSGEAYGKMIGSAESRTSRLLDLLPVVQKAENAASRVRLGIPGVENIRFGAVAPPSVSISRPTMSRISLALTDPNAQRLLRQSPRLLEQLYRQAVMEDQQ